MLITRFTSQLTPFSRRLLAALLALAVLLFGLHALTRGWNTPPFVFKLFNLDSELTFPAAFNAAQLLAAGLLAVGLAALARALPVRERVYWAFMAAVLFFLTVDEYASIHEWLTVPGRAQPSLRVMAALGLVVAAASVAAWRLGALGDGRVLAMLLVGLGLMGGGGIGFEYFHNYVICRPLYHLGLCDVKVTFNFEELFEMAGAALLVAGLAAYAQRSQDVTRWRWTKRALALGMGLWFVFVAGRIWLLPGAGLRLGAERVEVAYQDGAFALVGYRFSRPVLGSGDRATLRLYWRANRSLDSDYIVSAHLVTRSELRSVAQDDIPLGGWDGWRTPTWIPGVVMADVARFDLPDDLPAPESYWLLLRVVQPRSNNKYEVDWGTAQDVLPSETTLYLVEPDVLVLFSVPALPGGPLQEAQTAARYTFGGGPTLTGYTLPEQAEAGESLALAFAWRTDTRVDTDLIQFVHLFRTGGEDAFVFDQPPFADHLPTSDWPTGAALYDDAWAIPLPPDLPPGEYRVQTGLYDPISGERRTVTDEDGAPVTDASILLGTLRVE